MLGNTVLFSFDNYEGRQPAMGLYNAIRCIRYDHSDGKLWIDFELAEDAKIFAESPDWVLENHSAYRVLPESFLYTFVTGNVFGLGFKDAASAATWSDTSYKELWLTPDSWPHGNEPLEHERCMKLFCDRPSLWVALGKRLPVENHSTYQERAGRRKISKSSTTTKAKMRQGWEKLTGRFGKATDGSQSSDSSD